MLPAANGSQHLSAATGKSKKEYHEKADLFSLDRLWRLSAVGQCQNKTGRGARQFFREQRGCGAEASIDGQ